MNRRLIVLLAIAGAVSLVGLILLLVSPRLFFSLLNILGMVMLGVSALVMFLTVRKAKTVKPLALAITASVGFLTAVVISTLTPVTPGFLAAFFSFFLGFIVGGGWGLTSEVFREAGEVRSRGNAWYLLVWVATILLNQGIALLTGRPPAVGFLLVWFGAGLVAGQSAVTYFRYRKLAAAPLAT